MNTRKFQGDDHQNDTTVTASTRQERVTNTLPVNTPDTTGLPYGIIAPPPPKVVSQKTFVVVVTLLSLLFVVSAGTAAYLFYSKVPIQKGITPPLPTLTPALTLPLYTTNIQSADFETFVDAFSQALAHSDIPTLDKYTDQRNFLEVCVMADASCGNNWNIVSSQLKGKEIQFIIPQNPTIDQVTGGTVCQYLPQNTSSASYQFVLGLYVQNAGLVVPQSGEALYSFELPNKSHSTWLWNAAYLAQSQC